MDVLVVGASGFLGSNIVRSASAEHRIVAHSSAMADLSVPGSGHRLVADHGVDVVVNCAALAAVDACERKPALAARLNADLPRELAEACATTGAELVHISTDAVFGNRSGPYLVDGPTGPTNRYGATKLAGEQGVADALPRATILRTNVVGRSPSGTRSLFEFFANRLAAGERVTGFTDVWFRPVAAGDFWRIIGSVGPGIWHATGAELISKHAFAVAIADRMGFDRSLIVAGSVADGGLAAPRGTVMDVVPSIDSPPTLDQTLDRIE